MADAGVLIIGGGQAGAAVAANLRRAGYDLPICIAGDENVAPYQRPPLSKAYLLGELSGDRLEVRPPAFYTENNITLALNATATAIDRREQEVWFQGGGRRRYDILVLATGTEPRRLNVPGADLDGIMGLRTRADSDALRERLANASRVAVVGGGYIGLETAAAARKSGRDAVVIEAAPRLLARVAGEEIANFYAELHTERGVDVRVNAQAAAFEGDQKLTGVRLADGSLVPADIAVVGIGVTANDQIARAAGLACEDGVMTDESGRTEDPNIFAIGDCARAWSPIYERPLRLESVQGANDGAKAVAAIITGGPVPPAGCPWNWSDQYEIKLQTAGIAQGSDATVVRGSPDDRSFAVFYMRDNIVIACDAVNSAPEFLASRELILRRVRVSPDALRDTSISIKDLARTT